VQRVFVSAVVSPDSRPRDEFFSGDNFLSDHDIESYRSPLSGPLLLFCAYFCYIADSCCINTRGLCYIGTVAHHIYSCTPSKHQVNGTKWMKVQWF